MNVSVLSILLAADLRFFRKELHLPFLIFFTYFSFWKSISKAFCFNCPRLTVEARSFWKQIPQKLKKVISFVINQLKILKEVSQTSSQVKCSSVLN